MAFATRETDAPFILERVNDLNERPLQETDVEYLCRVKLDLIPPDVNLESAERFLRVFQNGLRKVVEERDRSRNALVRAEETLAEVSSRPVSRIESPSHQVVVPPDVLRARDQHILYLQYEIGQRDLQIQQRNDELQQNRADIDGLQEQKRLLEDEVQHLKSQMSRLNAENESLRQSIDSQMKHVENLKHVQNKNESTDRAMQDNAQLQQDNLRLREMSKELESKMREAVDTINEAATEHIALKRQIVNDNILTEELRRDNEDLRIRVKQFVKQLKNASVQTEAMSESDADSQLETLIAVVNRRVDEWKVMLRNQGMSVESDYHENSKQKYGMLTEMQHLLQQRNDEVDLLRNSLAKAVDEIEDAARIITNLKKRKESMPDEDLQILRRRVKDAHDNMSKMQRRIEMLEDDLSAQNHENNALILRIKDYEEGVYGLSEAVAEIKGLRKQLNSREAHIKDLVSRLNMAADDEPDFLMLTNKSILEREKLPYGAGTKQPSRKLTSGVSDRLMVQALQKQIEHLEEDRDALKRARLPKYSSSKRREERLEQDYADELDNDPALGKESNSPVGEETTDSTVTSARRASVSASDLLHEQVETLMEENRQLELSMREILETIKESRVQGWNGRDVEIRVPLLEKLVTVMANRSRAPSSRRTEDVLGADSAIYSEGDEVQVPITLRTKVDQVISRLRELQVKTAEGSMPGERTDSDNFQMPKSLIYSSMVQVLKLILRNGDPEGVVQKIEELGASIQNLAHTSRKPHGDPELLKDGAHAEQNEAHGGQSSLDSHSKMEQEISRLRQRLDETSNQLTPLAKENADLRSKIILEEEQSRKMASERNRGVADVKNEHRREIESLCRINGDLRADMERRENHVQQLRTALQDVSLRIIRYTNEKDTTILADRSEELIKWTVAPNVQNSGLDSSLDERKTVDALRMQMEQEHQRVTATLEAKIMRMENELKLQSEEREKERQELLDVVKNYGQSVIKDSQLRDQMAGMERDLEERNRIVQALRQELEGLRKEMHIATDSSRRQEEENRRVRENIESRYEAVIAKLRAELTSLKTQAVDVATADSGRTFVHDTIPVPTIQRTAAAGGSGASEQLRGQIREKDKELQKLGLAFQKFRDEMVNFPPPDQDVVNSLTAQRQEGQRSLDAARVSNTKLSSQLKKAKSDIDKLLAEMDTVKSDARRKEDQLRRYQAQSAAMAQRIAELEAVEPRELTFGPTSAESVSLLKQRITELEKQLAGFRVAEQPHPAMKPEVTQWEERKKWEKTTEKLREKVKEKEEALAMSEQTVATSKEALTRSERERAAMDKKIQTLTKRVAEATQQPAFLQRALDESSKEIESLKGVIEKYGNEQKRLETLVAKLQERESDHLASLEDLNTKHLKAVLVNEKLISDNKELNDQIKEFTEREEQRLVVEMEASSTGKPTEPSPDETAALRNPAEILKAVDSMKRIINDQQEELQRLRKLGSTMKVKIKKLEEDKFENQINVRPVDAAGDTKRTLNSLVAQNNKLQHEIKKAKEREDIAVGKAQQTETVKNVLEKRVLELLADKDEMLNRRHPEVKAIERQVENKIWSLAAEVEKWKFVALKANGVPISKEHKVETYEKVMKDNIIFRAEIKRLKNSLATQAQEVCQLRKQMEDSSPAEFKEMMADRQINGDAEKRIAELQAQLCNLIGDSPRQVFGYQNRQRT